MDESGLCEIALGGFKVFSELTRIPIGRLTFLFGPNSAGKSSVEDGIQLLSELLDTKDTIPDEERFGSSVNSDADNLQSRINRSWRRTGDAPSTQVELMQLGASALIDASGWGDLKEDVTHPDVGSYTPPSPGLHLLEALICFRKGFRSNDITFLLDGEPYLEYFAGREASLNFGHSLLSRLQIPEACLIAERTRPTRISTKGRWLRFRGGMFYDGNKRLDQWDYQEAWRWNDDGLELEEKWPPVPEIVTALAFFAEVFDRMLQNSCRVMRSLLDPYTVPASRTIPEPSELAFMFDNWSSVQASEHAPFHITMHGDPRYWRLARSFKRSVEQGLQAGGLGTAVKSEPLHHSVNRMLIDHLFRERGYQLMVDYRVLMTPEQFASRSILEGEVENTGDLRLSLLIAVHLEDPQGRRHAFTEVGSGLGYVLPVLTAACDDLYPVVIVQQPELHLHPALQAELGDVFVEMSREGRRLVVETHSEHLLLRVLKRLRQSGTATGRNPELHVEPDDVAILYFDPHLDGTTKVARLRVSEDGEFLDRWPRGFFTERDKELFDE